MLRSGLLRGNSVVRPGLVRPGLTRRRRSGFSPASIFASGEQGAWYDPSDLTTLYQNSEGTKPVRAAGDPVAYMADKSGNGNHATQATSAARPVYRTDGTLHWLEFDGVDDDLLIPAMLNAPSNLTYAESYTPTGKTWLLFYKKGVSGTFLGVAKSGSSINYFGDDAEQDFIRFDGVTETGGTRGAVYTASQSANVVLLQGNLLEASWNTTTAVYGYNDNNTFGIGAKSFGILIIERDLTTAEQGDLESYLAEKAGVTL